MSVLGELANKDANIQGVAKQGLEDERGLSGVLQGVLSPKDTIRFNSFKVPMLLSEEHAELLYHDKWDFFADLIGSDNTYHKYIAIYILANLTSVDTENRFENIFDDYYGLLEDKRAIPPSHLPRNSGKIARAKPQLQTRITDRLLTIDETHHRLDRKEMITSYAIEGFDECFEEAEDKERVAEFVRQQLNSESPKTRKAAKRFLQKWGESFPEGQDPSN